MVDYNRDGVINDLDEKDYWDDDYFLNNVIKKDDFFDLLGEDGEDDDE